jgi:RNA-dependent RNA polymerase
MVKFPSDHRDLEVCSFAKPMPMYLNRQLITLFSTRGVSDASIYGLLETMLERFDRALQTNEDAIDMLHNHADIAFNGKSTFSAAFSAPWYMLHAGIDVYEDPFVRGMIGSLRRRLIRDLKQRARIHVPRGICLFGVMDETGLLQPGECFVQMSAKHGCEWPAASAASGSTCCLLQQRVAVGRNPSLHPGDIRVLTARDVPQLRHLVDVVVFPSTGDRPHPNEMSGGDLDGDIYFVIWDQAFVNLSDFRPMEYKPPSNRKV